jgi:hypothetical protein
MHFFKPFPNVMGCFMGKDCGALAEQGWDLKDLILLKQVHGDKVIELKDSGDVEKYRDAEADAILSIIPDRPIAIKTADCVPVLFAHPNGLVGAVHAGWRGTAQGILLKSLKILEQDFPIKLSELKMAIGPTICGDHYEVGEEVARQFSERRYPGVLRPHGEKFLLTLQRVNFLHALEAGVLEKNLEVFSHCTFEDPEWHSYRRALKEGKQEAGRNYSWIVWKG